MSMKTLALIPVATLFTMSVAPKEAHAISYGTGGWDSENGPDWTIAPTSEQTCFLNSIGGAFGGSPGEYTNPSTQAVDSMVSITPFLANGQSCADDLSAPGCSWVFQDRNGGGPGIGGGVTCLYGQVTNQCVATWLGVNGQEGYCPAKSNTRCFLTAVVTAGELYSGLLNGQQASVTISQPTNGRIYIDGNDADYGNDNSSASMVCVDINDLTGSWGFAATGPASGTTTLQLRNSYPSGALVPTANVACGLTGISGNWMSAPGSLGWNDGVIASAPKGGFWEYDFTNARGGSISCVE